MNKYEHLRTKFDTLEGEVIPHLLVELNKSTHESKHIKDRFCIPVNVFNYTELVLHNDKLVFLDRNGYHYSLWCDCKLEDLIDILNNI